MSGNFTKQLKCGLLKKLSIMNAPLWVEHLQSSLFGGFAVATHKGAFIIDNFLSNPH